MDSPRTPRDHPVVSQVYKIKSRHRKQKKPIDRAEIARRKQVLAKEILMRINSTIPEHLADKISRMETSKVKKKLFE
jgi:hypothetical protein